MHQAQLTFFDVVVPMMHLGGCRDGERQADGGCNFFFSRRRKRALRGKVRCSRDDRCSLSCVCAEEKDGHKSSFCKLTAPLHTCTTQDVYTFLRLTGILLQSGALFSPSMGKL